MAEQNEFLMTPLDQMVSSESLQILKAAVPFAPASIQKFLSVFAKFQEFRTALSLFPSSGGLSAMSLDAPRATASGMLEEISRFAVGTAKDNIESLCSALNTVQILQAIQKEEEETANVPPAENTGEEGV